MLAQSAAMAAIVCYLVGTVWDVRASLQLVSRSWFIAVPLLLGIALHALALYRWIDLGPGHNLAFFYILSQVAWLIAVFTLLARWQPDLSSLGVLVYPFAVLSLILAVLFPGNNVFYPRTDFLQLMHIILALFAFSILGVAALQALLLALQDYLLRAKYALRLIHVLPPMPVMETLLLRMIWLGFLLLTTVIISSLYLFHNMFTDSLIQKTVLSIAVWLLFALLLLGRYCLGWRGQMVIRWTLAGVVFLIISFTLFYVGYLFI